ncbi:MAG: hypothetical protein WA840_11845 [Caulobacteraceae bacterium]
MTADIVSQRRGRIIRANIVPSDSVVAPSRRFREVSARAAACAPLRVEEVLAMEIQPPDGLHART